MATETCLSLNSNSSPYTTPPIHLADEPNFVHYTGNSHRTGRVNSMLDVIVQQTRELRSGKKIKAIELDDSIALVPHTRVELVIYCVRGSCPGPLDECGFLGDFPFEIGCKITTFFRSGQLFKAFFFIVSRYTLSDNQLPVVFFSCHPPIAGNKRGIYFRLFTKIAPLCPARMSTNRRFSS